MRRAWRTHDFRAVFHLACQAGFTPEIIARNTGLPADLVVNVMKGNTTLNTNSGAIESIASGFGMPDDFRGAVGLAPHVAKPARGSVPEVPQPREAKPVRQSRSKGQPAGKRERLPDFLPASVLDDPDFIEACGKRDLGAMFRITVEARFTVSHLARRCEMSVGQVSDYMWRGREAQSVDIFFRVSDGLHIPGDMLGIGHRSWEGEIPGDDQDQERPVTQATDGDFATELERIMTERGVGVRELARRTYYSAGYISNLCSGKSRPSSEEAEIIDQALDAGGLLPSLLSQHPTRGTNAPAIYDERSAADTLRTKIWSERKSRCWPARKMAEVLKSLADDPDSLPPVYALIRMIRNWEAGKHKPSEMYRLLYCQAFRMTEDELFAQPEVSRTNNLVPDKAIIHAWEPSSDYGIAEPHRGYGFGLNQGDIKPLLRNMSKASNAVPIIGALREIQRGYLIADRLTGGLSVSDAIRSQIPLVEMACEVTRGADRLNALDFACRFMEFCGWVHQDAGDLPSAMFWTDRAFDYAMEIGDQRTIAYTLMRKSAIATEAGNPAQGLGISNFALSQPAALTPRLRAVILRQRARAHAAFQETAEVERDMDNALAESVAGMSQEEEDRAPYCSPMYVAMEAGQSMVVVGQPENALAVLAKSYSEWSDRTQMRDYALCVSRLATAYAAADKPEEACNTAEEAMNLAYGIGSRRVIGQLRALLAQLGRWQGDPVIIPVQRKLSELIGSFHPE